MSVYINQIKINLENKVQILKKLLRLQIFLLDSKTRDHEHEYFSEIESLEKQLLSENLYFLENYRKYLEALKVTSISEINPSEKKQFEPIQEQIQLILELEEHFNLQTEMLRERAAQVKHKVYQQNKIKAYKK